MDSIALRCYVRTLQSKINNIELSLMSYEYSEVEKKEFSIKINTYREVIDEMKELFKIEI